MIILLVSLFLLLILGLPIAYALGASSLLYFVVYNSDLLMVIPQRVFSGFDNSFMIALPLYLLMGTLMNDSGLTTRLLDFCTLLVGRLKGGLGNVNVFVSLLFGGISGSSAADAAGLGKILIPEMEKRGYDREFTAGVTVASSTMGVIIPPSIPMIILAATAEQSVGKLFMAGIIPGVLIAITQMLTVTFISYKRNYPQDLTRYSFKERFAIIRTSILALILPVFVVGSIVLGIATVNESAAIGVVYALLVGLVIFKSFSAKSLSKAFLETIITSSTVMVIIATSQLYIWVLSLEQVPQTITMFINDIDLSPTTLLLLIMVIVLIVGTFLDLSPAILILTPVFLPAVMAAGISPIQFGTLLVVGLAIGLTTPPVGMCLNVVSAISGLNILRIFRGAAPLLLCNVFVMLLIIFVPQVTEFLPNLLFD